MGGLQANWLAVEMETSETALANWSPGIQASFNSLFDEPSDWQDEYEKENCEDYCLGKLSD